MLVHPTYFSPITQYIAMFHSDVVVFEAHDNFQKQTYRNRCKIAGPNGMQQLTIPIIKTSGKTLTKDIRIDYKDDWQTNHFRSIQTAYRSSPFFEFYEDDIRPLYENKFEFLLDFNIECHQIICDSLDEKMPFTKSLNFEIEPQIKDGRSFVIAKKEPTYNLKSYVQVFDDKFNFIANLSILDLLFNEGPNTTMYFSNNLKSIQ